MKAAIHTRYGTPEVVQVKDIPIPSCGNDEFLIKVMASTVNRTDAGFRSAEYFISRFWSGLFSPKYKTLGCEFAGMVVAVGEEVSRFQPGDRVFGYNDQQFGGHAEYSLQKGEGTIALIPANISFEDAAAITEGAHYALGNIRAAGVQPGQQVLVYGATGAIGSAAVQLLKYFGAHVTAVCNSKNIALVQSLGADRVVDYEREDFTRTDLRYEFVFDAVGKTSFGVCKPLLKPGGVYISTELGRKGENVYLSIWGKMFRKERRILFPLPSFSQDDLEWLKQRVEAGQFKPVIDRYFSLDEIVDAYRYVETGQKVGNVIIKVCSS